MFVIVVLLQLALFIGLAINLPKERDQIMIWTLGYIIGMVAGLVTLFFADKRGNCVSEQTVISVAVVIWLFGYVTGIVIGG